MHTNRYTKQIVKIKEMNSENIQEYSNKLTRRGPKDKHEK
jgi:hypothetical protein